MCFHYANAAYTTSVSRPLFTNKPPLSTPLYKASIRSYREWFIYVDEISLNIHLKQLFKKSFSQKAVNWIVTALNIQQYTVFRENSQR